MVRFVTVRKIGRQAALAILVPAALLFGLSHYLAYATPVQRADAVIVFMGPGQDRRIDLALDLIDRGLAQWLIMPGGGRIIRYGRDTSLRLVPVQNYTWPLARHYHDTNSILEDTHFELLHARKIMKRFNLNSAIFIAAPYHLRRIKIIAANVFGLQDFRFFYLADGVEKHKTFLLDDLTWTVSETAKIVYFPLSILAARHMAGWEPE